MGDSITPNGTPPPPAGAQPAPSATALVVRQAAVVSAPPHMQPAPDGTPAPQLRAVVVDDASLPPDQMRLRTDSGDIVVRTTHRLPADTSVLVDLQRHKTALTATLRVAARTADMQPPTPQPSPPVTPQATPPAPPTQAGDTLVALVLSGTLPQPPAPPPALTAEQATLLRQMALQMLAGGTAARASVPLPVLTGLTASADPAAFIKALPPEQQAALRAMLPAAPPPDDAPAQPVAQPAAPPAIPEDSDHGLLSVLKALTSARLTQQAVALPPPAGTSAQTALLKSLFPLLEGLQAQNLTRGSAAPPPLQTLPAPPLTAQALPVGTGATLKIIALVPPPSAVATTAPTQMPAQALVQTPVQTTAPPTTPPVAFPLHTTPPATPATLPAPAAGQLSGEVIGQTRDGMAVIKTPVADFVLALRAPLPTGTRLVLEATPLPLADLAARLSAAGSANLPDVFSFSPLDDSTWPALDEALALLAQNRPDAATTLANTLPQPGPRMVPATLFFLAALRLGMVENWVGPQTLHNLREAGGRTAADKLGGDFSRIARQAGEPLTSEWRGFSLPLMHDSQLSNIQLFVRRQHDEGDTTPRGGKTTRFIVNLTLSRLGGMQLDGLMHEATPAAPDVPKRLDMIIRTDGRLPPKLMQDLQDAYALGLRDSQITGSLNFQARRQGWVDIARTPHDPRDI